MKIVINYKEKNIEKISKQIVEKEAYGTTIDIYKLSKKSTIKFFNIIENYIKEKKEINMWTEVAIQELLKEERFYSKDTKFKWVEIDNFDDLRQAEELFKEN